MSCTEIYVFDKDGIAELHTEVQNAWRGAPAIWRFLEEKHLPAYRPPYTPEHVATEAFEKHFGYKPMRSSSFDVESMKEIWGLAHDKDKLSEYERIVLATTFDNVVIRKEMLPKVIKAFNSFQGETSLKEQAVALQKIVENESIIAVAWNQTSVCGGVWEMSKLVREGEHEDWHEDDADDEGLCTVYVPYSLNVGDKHWFLFPKS